MYLFTFTLPIFLKYQTSKNFALTGGGQVDFLNTLKNDAGGGYYKRMFTSNSNAATVGFELFPVKPVVPADSATFVPFFAIQR